MWAWLFLLICIIASVLLIVFKDKLFPKTIKPEDSNAGLPVENGPCQTLTRPKCPWKYYHRNFTSSCYTDECSEEDLKTDCPTFMEAAHTSRQDPSRRHLKSYSCNFPINLLK